MQSHAQPADRFDTGKLDAFLSNNAGKPVVAVLGLGFVGSVMSFVCANALHAEYAVIGIDLPTAQGKARVSAINDRQLHIQSSDPKVAEYFDRAHGKGNLLATWDASAIAHADVVIIDINLDVAKMASPTGQLLDFDVDLEPFKKAIRTIGAACKPDVLVIVETTVPPGTCRHVVHPLLLEALTRRGLPTDRFRLGHSYERVMPGPNYVDSIQNFYRVYAGIDEVSADATEAFLKTVIRTDEYPLTRLVNTNATEMAKVLENSYRSMNIAFIVEWSRFAEEAGVDLYSVVNAIRMRSTHSNMMLPGIGVGGYCLTKDPLLASWSRRNLFGSNEGLAQSEQGVRINDQMPYFAFDFLRRQFTSKPLSDSRVLLLGAAYRGDVADTRFSPVAPLFRLLRDQGSQVVVHDYFVDFWEECAVSVTTDLPSAFDAAIDVAIICTGHSAYGREFALTRELMRYPRPLFVLDTIGLLPEAQLDEIRTRHTVRVLGRGDLA